MPGEAQKGLSFVELPIFERGAPGRTAASIAALDVPDVDARTALGELHRAEPAHLPEVSEPEAFRHFVRLSQQNFSIDTQFYPLGSCTMKFNPKVNEWAARLDGFARLHPLTPDHLAQGALELMVRLEALLAEIVGMDGVSLQPAAGAQGELTGLMMIRAYHHDKGRAPRKVFIPESAHGTNPASCALNGFEAVTFPAGSRGVVEASTLASALAEAGDDVAGLMITNPNTLGLYESDMPEITRLVHEKGGLVYGDGANMNAVLGRARPGDVGVDVMQYNLHKTFTTPHGGGGPGSGPVAFKKILEPFQPSPVVRRDGDRFLVDRERPKTVGRVRSFLGNFGMMVRAYTYIRELGPDGLKAVSDMAVLNANYLAARLSKHYPIAFSTPPLHEAVFSDKELEGSTSVKTLDLAKRLIDYGFHPPTVYFPLVVRGALMIEPTETETKQTIDGFVDAMVAIKKEAQEQPEMVKSAPHLTRLGRLDEARAARKPRLRWSPAESGG
ncbi:MAG: aminomethyl-transferring glycine dehydrogenase subunit GcvPB [Myxococcales bacterium]|nr:aminomethyl-transferring glycine dehydrogenase subunit GcvPB [Myxococcales bacterium]MCB9579177.1 aminomethyl-transferring glycine dehydrogenase subunit GcvPB [Polyangiaceae bacterium]